MNINIIEDCSPYYIRFTYVGMEKVIESCKKEWFTDRPDRTFIHHRYPVETANTVLANVPWTSSLGLNENRVSLFVTKPGRYYRAHKDGLTHRYSLNYTISILDDKCVTSWYSDDVASNYELDTLNGTSRELKGFQKENHSPLMSMTAIEGECILFNTEIFHDFDNSKSTNERVVLTLRSKNPESVFFDDAKAIIFAGKQLL